jgi:hypothetical protein
MTWGRLDSADKFPHRVQNRDLPTIKHFALEQALHFYAVILGFDKMSKGGKQFVVEPDEFIPDLCPRPKLPFIRLEGCLAEVACFAYCQRLCPDRR